MKNSSKRLNQRIGRVVGGTLLNLAAAGGVLCIIAVIAAAGFNISIILFKTGSMSPTIPAGSLAVVKEIPAAEIRIGDIVTVERADALPITHRVVAVAPAIGTTTATETSRSITLRGDANVVDDPAPYSVDQVRIVLFSIPGLAGTLTTLSQPPVMVAISVGAAVLVSWAFWPRKSESHDPRHRMASTR
jgi:signal peptidase